MLVEHATGEHERGAGNARLDQRSALWRADLVVRPLDLGGRKRELSGGVGHGIS